MPVKLSTTVSNIQTIPNENNRILVNEFYEFMKSSGTSDKYQNNNLKTIIAFGRFLEPSVSLDPSIREIRYSFSWYFFRIRWLQSLMLYVTFFKSVVETSFLTLILKLRYSLIISIESFFPWWSDSYRSFPLFRHGIF